MDDVLIVTWLGGGASQPAVVVSHAGLGSPLEAFRAGVPSVCLPLGRDQAGNAAAAAGQGAAIALPASAPASQLRAAIARALHSPALRTGARRMASVLAACGGAAAAADQVEQVAQRADPPGAHGAASTPLAGAASIRPTA